MAVAATIARSVNVASNLKSRTSSNVVVDAAVDSVSHARHLPRKAAYALIARQTMAADTSAVPTVNIDVPVATNSVYDGTAANLASSLPITVQALIGGIILFGILFIGGLLYFWYRAYLRRKALGLHTAKTRRPISHASTAQGYLDPFDFEGKITARRTFDPFPSVPEVTYSSKAWAPQLPLPVTVPKATRRASKARKQWEKSIGKVITEKISPPSVRSSLSSIVSLPYKGTAPPSPTTYILPPGLGPALNNRDSVSSIPSVVLEDPEGNAAPVPLTPPSVPPTPRLQSFAAHITGNVKQPVNKKLPRAMKVTTTFEATLPDELRVDLDEVLVLLQEFADQWCLVQRGQERGVIPRFCLSENITSPKQESAKRTSTHLEVPSPPSY